MFQVIEILQERFLCDLLNVFCLIYTYLGSTARVEKFPRGEIWRATFSGGDLWGLIVRIPYKAHMANIPMAAISCPWKFWQNKYIQPSSDSAEAKWKTSTVGAFDSFAL